MLLLNFPREETVIVRMVLLVLVMGRRVLVLAMRRRVLVLAIVRMVLLVN